MEADFWETSATQMALLLGFMRGCDILRTGNGARQAFRNSISSDILD
jgi:hypothetical protein